MLNIVDSECKTQWDCNKLAQLYFCDGHNRLTTMGNGRQLISKRGVDYSLQRSETQLTYNQESTVNTSQRASKMVDTNFNAEKNSITTMDC